MPLIVGQSALATIPVSLSDFFKKYKELKRDAENLCKQPVKPYGPEHLLYVHQREYAVVSPQDEFIHILGSEDATTCHIVILRHSGSGVTGLGHFDGVSTMEGIHDLVNNILQMSRECSLGGRLELHLIGGFLDEKNTSAELSLEILRSFHSLAEEIHLKTACITDANDVLKRDGVHYPVFYGAAVDVKSGAFCKATFPDKGPDLPLRSAVHFMGIKTMPNLYNFSSHQLVIGPYDWSQKWTNVNEWIALPDSMIRKYLSTSPEQEPEDFANNTRASLIVIRDNPQPGKTLFPGGRARRYNKDPSTGKWIKVL